jgi:hypothetical protein
MNTRVVSIYFCTLFLLFFYNTCFAAFAAEPIAEAETPILNEAAESSKSADSLKTAELTGAARSPLKARESHEYLESKKDRQPDPGSWFSEVDNVSSELLAKEIELLKLNTRLKLYLLPHSPWSARRAAGIGFTNSTLTAVGALMNGCGRFRYLDCPKKAPSPLFEDAGIVRFLANCVGTGAAVFEFCSDSYVDIKGARHGVSLPIMHDRALALREEIDELLNQRQAIIASAEFGSQDMAALEHEGVVFKDLRDAGANEFALYFAQAKGNRTARRLGYLIAVTSNVASGAGTLVGIESNHLHGLSKVRRTHMGGVGGICDIVTGSMNMMAPVAIRGGAALQRHFTRDTLCRELDCRQSNNVSTLQAHQNACEQALAGQPELEVRGVILRSESLKAAGRILEKRCSMRMSEQRAARNVFIESMATATVAGGSKIANGIGGTLGAYKYTRDSYHRFEVQGGTSIAYGAGNALAALETARVRLGDELKTCRSAKDGSSKRDVLNKQLAELDSLQAAPQLAASPHRKTM